MNKWPCAIAGFAALSGAAPASATIYHLQWSGTVHTVEGDAAGSEIRVGDTISAAFQFDDAVATGPVQLPLGGGIYSIYNAALTALSLSVGSYSVSYSRFSSSLVYMNDSFGSDGIIFGLDGLPGGPFGSTFANIQFQARGLSSAIDNSGLANGLPYDRFTPSFFAVFGNGVTADRVFGSLSVSNATAVPEPETWAMLVCGFGIVGGVLRRRKTEQVLGVLGRQSRRP